MRAKTAGYKPALRCTHAGFWLRWRGQPIGANPSAMTLRADCRVAQPNLAIPRSPLPAWFVSVEADITTFAPGAILRPAPVAQQKSRFPVFRRCCSTDPRFSTVDPSDCFSAAWADIARFAPCPILPLPAFGVLATIDGDCRCRAGNLRRANWPPLARGERAACEGSGSFTLRTDRSAGRFAGTRGRPGT